MDCQRFEWVLWPGDLISSAFDEFVCGGFRVQLMGQRLAIETVQPRAEPRQEATELAERYTSALRRHTPTTLRLLTDQEVATMPPQFITVPVHSRVADLSRGKRSARNEVIGEARPRLRRCYDYLQAAVEDQEHMLSNLYKLIETVEGAFGGEADACKILKVTNDLKLVKRLANEDSHDERHAPDSPTVVRRVGEHQRQAALESARKVLRAYENEVLSRNDSPDS